MNRRTFLRSGLKTTAFLYAAQWKDTLWAKPFEQSLYILHTNDVHSRLDPFPMDGGKYQGLGGIRARKALIDQIKYGKEQNTLLLDAGDMFQGTPYFNFFKGEAEIKSMNYLKYDAGTLGNHDFDFGMENLALQLSKAKFPIVNCNYDFIQTPLENKIPPYIILQKGNIRTGIMGVGIELNGLVPDKLFGNTKYLDPVQKANETAYRLKKEKCDFIICLSHLGFAYEQNKIDDKKLAKQTENIDLIIGGHTHTFLEEPHIEKNKMNKPVIINQVGWGGINLGTIEVNFSLFKRNFLSKNYTVRNAK